MLSAICFNLVLSKILMSGNGLKQEYLFDASINSLPNDKILDFSKFNAFADDKINVT